MWQSFSSLWDQPAILDEARRQERAGALLYLSSSFMRSILAVYVFSRADGFVNPGLFFAVLVALDLAVATGIVLHSRIATMMALLLAGAPFLIGFLNVPLTSLTHTLLELLDFGLGAGALLGAIVAVRATFAMRRLLNSGSGWQPEPYRFYARIVCAAAVLCALSSFTVLTYHILNGHMT